MKTIVLALLLATAGCATVPSRELRAVHHVVLCWLKEPGSTAGRARVIEASKALRHIPGVLAVNAGEPVLSDRPIVDDSFDVAVVMTFATPQDLADYLAHPLHRKVQEEVLRPLVNKIVVYDFTDTGF